MPMIVHDETPACCPRCERLGLALDLHKRAIHAIEETRSAVADAARECDRHHRLPSVPDRPEPSRHA
jgi:hypothetical protein